MFRRRNQRIRLLARLPLLACVGVASAAVPTAPTIFAPHVAVVWNWLPQGTGVESAHHSLLPGSGFEAMLKSATAAAAPKSLSPIALGPAPGLPVIGPPHFSTPPPPQPLPALSSPPSPTPTPAPTATPSPTSSSPCTGTNTSPPPCSPPPVSTVKSIIVAAANAWGVDSNWMLNIAQCESSFDAYAINSAGPYDGLYQFRPSTFYANGGTNIWDATDQANITAKMLAHGQAWQWSCA